jgi:hypothetical protein
LPKSKIIHYYLFIEVHIVVQIIHKMDGFAVDLDEALNQLEQLESSQGFDFYLQLKVFSKS